MACAIRSGWRPPLDPRSALSLAVLWYAVLAAVNWLVGVVAPPLGGVAGLPLGALDFLFLPAALGAIAAVATADLSGSAPGRLSGRWHLRLGQWSFALYLTQTLVINAVAARVGGGRSASSAAVWIGTVLVCVALAAIVSLSYENPLERRLRRRLLTRRRLLHRVVG